MKNDKENVAWREAIKSITLKLASNTSGSLNGVTTDSNNVISIKNLQSIHTPFELCFDIIGKLKEECGCFDNKDFLVFNLEFIDVLVYDYGVELSRIWFLTDCREKAKICKSSRYNGVNIMEQDFFEMLQEKKEGRKFDVILMNSPYQGKIDTKRTSDDYQGSSDARNNLLWPKFVTKGIELCKDDGYCAFIHPPKWRKPEDKMWDVITKNQIEYLEIHNKKDGEKTFGATTRYDWYILKKHSYQKPTNIKDEMGKTNICDFREISFIPNYNFDLFNEIIAKEGERKLEIVYSTPYHHQNSKRMNKGLDGKFVHPCVHGIRADNEIIIWYSNTTEFGHFGISKVILNDGETLYPIIDIAGKYGMTEGPFAIKIKSMEEAKNIKNAIESEKFKDLVKSSKWSSFRTDYKMFKHFRSDFYKEFI